MRRSLSLVAFVACTLAVAGCELIVDFDRSRIGDAGTDVDSFVPPRDASEDDAGPDDAGPDAAMDADLPDAAMDAAMDDAGMDDAGTDAGMDDAGSDAGPTMTCGNGTMEGTEACDDGNTTTETECAYGTMTCTLCSADCTSTLSLSGRYCGDGTVDSGDSEACDDGDMDDGDGCSSSCAEESGYTCTGEPSTCTTTCGDGVVAGTEECDDGDTDDSDGCSSSCAEESGYTCTGEPSTCTTTCGDGIVAGAEACDDGNAMACGTCSADCSTAITPGPATGDITAIPQTELSASDSDSFALSDGTTSVTFYFDTAGDGGGTGTAIDVSGDTTAAEVASSIATAINAEAGLGVTASISTTDSSVVELVNDQDGVIGNVAITESVANAGFVVSGMSGGTAYDCASGTGCTDAPVCASGSCGTSNTCD